MIPELLALPAHRITREEEGTFEVGCSLVSLNWYFAVCGVGEVMLTMAGAMVKPEATRKLSLCTQQAVPLVLAGGTPELHSEENHANQSTDEKRSVKRENQIYFFFLLQCMLYASLSCIHLFCTWTRSIILY